MKKKSYRGYIFVGLMFGMLAFAGNAYARTRAVGSSGDSMFPVFVKTVKGTDYVRRAFPTQSQISTPLAKFAGRFFDGYPHNSGTSQTVYWRFLTGAESVVSSNSRIYAQLGSTIVAYDKADFITRLATEPMSFFQGTKNIRNEFVDGMLPWDGYFYPEEGGKNGWLEENCDCPHNMNGFDIDDRGYIYLAHDFGLGIVRDNGSKIVPVTQFASTEGMVFADGPKKPPFFLTGTNGTNKINDLNGAVDALGRKTVRAIKSGTQYFMVGGGTGIVNVTDPLNASFVASGDWGDVKQSGNYVASTDGSSVKIYAVADFVTGGAPKKEFSAGEGKYVEITGDKAGRFFALYQDRVNYRTGFPVGVSISTFSLTSGSYTESKTVIDPSTFNGNRKSPFRDINFSNGYLTAVGITPAGNKENVRMWTLAGGTLSELPTSALLSDYYDEDGVIINTSVEKIGGKDYLFISTYELTDVFELGTSSGSTTDTGCAVGNTYSTQTGKPCVCVLNPTFPMGTKSQAVKDFQQVLKNLGLYSGNVDGTYGPITRGADLAHCISVKFPTFVGSVITSTPPVINSITGPKIIGINELGSWTAKATDANGDDLSWSVNWGSGKSVLTCKINPQAGTSQGWEYTASNSWNVAGTYSVIFYVNDCKGGRAEKTFSVTVSGRSSGGKPLEDVIVQ